MITPININSADEVATKVVQLDPTVNELVKACPSKPNNSI
jgi:hypothetical protein